MVNAKDVQQAAERLKGMTWISPYNEKEIERAIAYIRYHYHQVVKGSAAVPLAAYLKGSLSIRKPILIISGGNIKANKHKEIYIRWKDEVQ